MQTDSIFRSYDACAASAERAFYANDRRLFISEQFRNLAVHELCAILTKEKPDSFLFITDTPLAATELNGILSETVGEIENICSFRDFLSVLNGENADRENARKFREAHPRIIMTLTGEGNESVLHHVLCENKTLGGKYPHAKKNAPYCVSDFLLDGNYDFVVVDRVYNFLKHHLERGENDTNKYYADEFDKIELFGKNYYTPVANSFNRLNAITSSARNCVLISSEIIGEKAVEFYMALELMQREFSVAATGDAFKDICTDYESDCNRVCNSFLFAKDDEEIITSCIRLSRESVQKMPNDISGFKKAIEDILAYVSRERLCLSAFNALLALGYKFGRVDDVVKVLDDVDNAEVVAKCIVKAFFSDSIKGEVENCIFSSYVNDMSDDEIVSVVNLFKKYGIVHPIEYEMNYKTLGFFRDNSAFSEFVRKESGVEFEFTEEYSVLGTETAEVYKAVRISQMLKGEAVANGRFSIKLTAPLVVVSETPAQTVSVLKKFIKDVKVSDDYLLLAEKTAENRVVVCDYEQISLTALWLNIGSVVLFDTCADVQKLFETACKLSVYCKSGEKIMMFSSDRLSWFTDYKLFTQKNFFGKSLPFYYATRYKTGRDTIDSLTKLTKRLSTVYSFISDVSAGKNSTFSVDQAADELVSSFVDYALIVPFSKDETAQDFVWLRNNGKNIAGVYENSCFVGINNKKNKEDEKDNDKTANFSVYMNACLKYLTGTCDVEKNYCNGCEKYGRYMRNEFSVFEDSAEGFYGMAVSDEEIKSGRKAEIKITSSERGDGEVYDIQRLRESQADMRRAFKTVHSQIQKYKGNFRLEYSQIEAIRGEIYKIYAQKIKKYYNEIISLLDGALTSVSQKAIKLSEIFAAQKIEG